MTYHWVQCWYSDWSWVSKFSFEEFNSWLPNKFRIKSVWLTDLWIDDTDDSFGTHLTSDGNNWDWHCNQGIITVHNKGVLTEEISTSVDKSRTIGTDDHMFFASWKHFFCCCSNRWPRTEKIWRNGTTTNNAIWYSQLICLDSLNISSDKWLWPR